MRTLLSVGAVGLVLAVSTLSAEARARIRVRSSSAPVMALPIPAVAVALPALRGQPAQAKPVQTAEAATTALRPAPSQAAATTGSLAGPPPSPAVDQPMPPKLAQTKPWCEPERRIGAGAGFCLIN